MEYILNEYFTRRLGKNKFLVSTRCGTCLLLNKKDYRGLNNGQYKINKKLIKRLLENKILMTDENTKDIINRIKMQYLQDKPLYMNCIINLTHKCNLSCLYCHANTGTMNQKEMDMSDETIDAYIDFIFNLPHKTITLEFQGGEPLLRFDKIKYILEEFKKRNKKNKKKLSSAIIVSNLTLMTENIADFLIKNKVQLSSSLDGSKELHDTQRSFLNGNGSYDKVIFWHNCFKKRKKHVGLMPTITKKSIEFGPKPIIDEYVKLGKNSIFMRYVKKLGRGRINKNLSPTKEEFAEFLKKAFDYCVYLLDKKDYLVAERNITNFVKNIFFPTKQYMCMRRPCGAAINQISVTPNGDIYPCDIARSIPKLKIGNIKTTKFSDIVLNSLELRTMVQEFQPLCDTCVYNNFCGNCAVVTYAKYNSFVARTPGDFDCYVNKYILDYIFEKIDDKKYIKYIKTVL
ncbi:MAG: SPASM domain-containing protein, partial [Candidatus Aenigmarchaeota archaeon]|nr:SPASM domain-containing protein [Candidatus Aenigmarchaeota archaeon]